MTLLTANNIPATPWAGTANVKAWLVRLAAHATRIHRARAGKRKLLQLSPAQLRDIGIDASEISDGPTAEVNVTTMTDLMSLR